MDNANQCTATGDPFDLGRFVEAQSGDYEQALSEIRSGRKRSQWMWYIPPPNAHSGLSAHSRWWILLSSASVASPGQTQMKP